jgi:hypothetical protein
LGSGTTGNPAPAAASLKVPFSSKTDALVL